MSRHNFAARLIVGFTLALPLVAQAQVSEVAFGSASTLYDSGVEAYFRGCSTEAESYFTSLMGQDPNDPRAFYFRALTLMRQGREDEARSDMEIGAEIEARFPRRFDIGKTLERVQGSSRLLLEQYRNRARAAASMTPAFGAMRSSDTGVLREHRIVPLDEFARPGEPQSFAAPTAAPTPPPAKPVLAPPATPEPAAAAPGNPFGDDTTDATPKSESKTPPAKPTKAAPPDAESAQPAKVKLPPPPKAATPLAPKPADDDSGNPF